MLARTLLIALALTTGLSACTITSSDVEPTPAQEPVSGKPTVTYHLDGRPVVANNFGSLGDIFLLAVPLFRRSFPVEASILSDSTLILAAIDAQRNNKSGQPTPQKRRHDLMLTVPQFHGPGTYTSFSASFTEQYQMTGQQWAADGPVLVAAPGAPQRFTITEWTPTTGQLRGTFELTLQDPGSGQQRVVTDGWFFAVTQ